MKVNTETFAEIRQPMYVLEEARLRKNLALIQQVAQRAGVEIILAFKAYPHLSRVYQFNHCQLAGRSPDGLPQVWSSGPHLFARLYRQ